MNTSINKYKITYAVEVSIECSEAMLPALVAEARKALANSVHNVGADGELGHYQVKTTRAKKVKTTDDK